MLALQGVVLWAMPVKGHTEEKGVSLKLRLLAGFSSLIAETKTHGQEDRASFQREQRR